MSYYRFSNSNYQRPSFFGGFQFFPPVIKTLLISNIAVYLASWFIGLFRIKGVALGGFIAEYLALNPLGEGFFVWQLLTYLFLHGDLMHLLFNMFALWMFGMELENTWGSKKFLSYYLVCGVGAGVCNLLIAPLFAVTGPTIGASGAIYGVLIAFGMMFPDRPIFLYFLLRVRAKYFVLFYVVIAIYYGVTGTANGVAHFAHLGGAAVGFIYLVADQRRLPWQGLLEQLKSRMASTGGRIYPKFRGSDVSDAKYHDVQEREELVNQQRIDEILDKISQHGYQSLSEKEKKILFEASKKLN